MRTKFVSLITILGALSLLVTVALSGDAQQSPRTGAGKTAEQVYKNIQVLQGIPADQVLPIMRFMRDSLGGVTCEYCHEEDRSKDDNQVKQTARKMIAMELAINKATFEGRTVVTCNTCHRGSPDPVAVPVIPEGNALKARSEGLPPRPVTPTAEQILARYVQALGGDQAIRKITSLAITGMRDVAPGGAGNTQSVQASFELYQKSPDRMVLLTQLPNGPTANGFDGVSAWSQDNRGRVTENTGVELDRAKRDADFYASLDLMQTYPRLVVRGIDKVNGNDAYAVQAIPPGDTAARLWFDVQTGLLVRKVTTSETPLGDDPVSTDYYDYRNIGGGAKVPFLVRTYTMTASGALHVQKVQANVPIDDTKFAEPASKPADRPAAQ